MKISTDNLSYYPPGDQTYYDYAIVWPPQDNVMKKIVSFLAEMRASFDSNASEGFIIVELPDPETFVASLSETLTPLEAANTRVLMSTTKSPSLGAFKDVVSLAALVDQKNTQWLTALLDESRYVSYAQPIVSADGEWDTVAHEFLIRGMNTAGDMIYPDTMFAAAKDPQMLYNLDRAARINAVITAARMRDDGDVFINFLPDSIYDPNVCLKTTVAAVQQHDVAPDRVVIEIVESHQIDDIGHLRNIVSFFRSVGFRVALDDFGTGFNNLDMYIALEPDFVKLDKSLTMNLTDDDPRLSMVKGIVRSAHSSKIQVVAEGIESATNARVASDCGVDRMQGYFFGRPGAVD